MRLNPNDLRDALREHADEVVPGPLDLFDGLDARVRSVRRRRRLATALSGLAVLAVVVAAPMVRGTTTRPERSTGPPGAATLTPVVAPAVPVYWLSDGQLAREFRQLGPVRDPVTAAVDTMLHSAPLDPDYRSGWPRSATAVVQRTAGGFAVDLSRPPTDGCQAIQQLVHTITAAAQRNAPVVVLVRGRLAARQPGLATCAPADGAVRAPQLRTLVAVQISSPNHGDRVGRSFLLTGSSRVVDGSLTWQVRDAATGTVLAIGAPTGDVNSPDGWALRIDLPATAAGRDVVLEVTGKPAPHATVGSDTKLLHVTG